MLDVTFFNDVEELENITGLTEDKLWGVGFDLDDMDFGLVSDKELYDEWNDEYDPSVPYYENWLTNQMNDHCVGYRHTEYKGKHYYTVHHA